MTVTDTTRPANTAQAAVVVPDWQRPVYGAAHLETDGTVTVGAHADGSAARWRIAHPNRAEHTTILGATAAGKSSLLRSVLHGAHTTGIDAQVIDPNQTLTGICYPAAGSLTAARKVLEEQHELAQTRVADPDTEKDLRLLVIDDLHELVKDRSFSQALSRLSRLAGRARIAVLTGTSDASLSGFGGRYLDASTVRHALTVHLLLLRTDPDSPMQTAALGALGVDTHRLPPIPEKFRDGSRTAGVGYLPRRTTPVPFRAWLP